MVTSARYLLLTGAAGGLGRALVSELLQQEGIRVLAVDRNPAGLDSLPDHPRLQTFPLDLTDPPAIRELRQRLDGDGLQVHTLVNNAGISDFFPVSEGPDERLQQILSVNTLAPIRMVNAFLDHLIARQGRVIQISSESVKMTGLFQPYSATKIALEAFSRVMRQELRCKGVELVVVRPGAIRTPLLGGLEQAVSSNPDSLYRRELAAFLRNAKGMVGRESSAEEMARRIARVVLAKRPRPYYHFNNNAVLSLFAALPEAWADRIVHRLIREKST